MGIPTLLLFLAMQEASSLFPGQQDPESTEGTQGRC